MPSRPFNPSRLTLARKRRGLTKVALGSRAGLTARSLSEFESGRQDPSVETLNRIASALRFPVAFFGGSDLEQLDPGGVSFRSQKSMSAAQRDAALSAGTLASELSRWIAETFNLPVADLPDLRDFDAENAANVLRNEWGIGERPIGNMVHLLESKGVRVFSLAERGKEIDAYSLWCDGVPFVLLNTLKTPERGRLDAAHELGHLVLHRHGGMRGRGRDVEKEAQKFGAALLMPERSVRSAVPRLIAPSMATIIQLKQNWKVSAAALAHRLYSLGLLSEWSYRGVNVELSRRGRTVEPQGLKDRETSQVFEKVFRSLRESGVSRSDVARQLDLHVSDIDALIYGLSPTAVQRDGRSVHDPEAAERRAQIKLVR